MIRIRLPYPPSVNHLWRKGKTRAGKPMTYTSEEGKAFRSHVAWIVASERLRPVDSIAAVHMDAHPPDRRERDGDNLWKATLDALVNAGALAGDSNRHIERQSMQWHPPTKDAHVIITITPIRTDHDQLDAEALG